MNCLDNLRSTPPRSYPRLVATEAPSFPLFSSDLPSSHLPLYRTSPLGETADDIEFKAKPFVVEFEVKPFVVGSEVKPFLADGNLNDGSPTFVKISVVPSSASLWTKWDTANLRLTGNAPPHRPYHLLRVGFHHWNLTTNTLRHTYLNNHLPLLSPSVTYPLPLPSSSSVTPSIFSPRSSRLL